MKHFTLAELTYSATAQTHGIANIPNPASIANLNALVDNILDPLRSAWGKPIVVNSGYRCVTLNCAVGGSPRSQHTKGEAADITAGSASENRQLFNLVQELGLPFDQLIDEANYKWLHISYSRARNRSQVLHLTPAQSTSKRTRK